MIHSSEAKTKLDQAVLADIFQTYRENKLVKLSNYYTLTWSKQEKSFDGLALTKALQRFIETAPGEAIRYITEVVDKTLSDLKLQAIFSSKFQSSSIVASDVMRKIATVITGDDRMFEQLSAKVVDCLVRQVIHLSLQTN